jgi:hypothetical protein
VNTVVRGKAEKVKIRCTSCWNEKDPSQFYVSNSPFHKFTNKLHVCKDCFWDYVGDDLNKLINALRMIDKPFIMSLYVSSQEEAENSDKNTNPIKNYIKNVSMPQYKNFTWDDSDFEGHKKTGSLSNELPYQVNDEFDEEVIRYWGNGYEDWEIEFLEDEKIKLMSSFECPDYGMEMIMKDICFINLDIEKIRRERKPNSSKEITALIKTRSDLMNDANMKPIQSTGADANDQVTFGTLIKKWENERPVPKPLDDEMKRYIDTFMVGHLAKMEGLNNEMTDKYEKAISKYTINFEDIHKNSEDFED